MEMGEWTLYFVQYEGTHGRWFTKNLAYSTSSEALAAASDHLLEYGEKTRVVEQTTRNTVWH